MTIATAADPITRVYEDGVLAFHDEPRRAYKWQGTDDDKPRRLVSVTSVLGCLAKPALLRWSEACGAEGAVRAERMGELVDVEPEEAIHRVRLLNLGADAAKTKAATRGLTTHDALELWATDGSLPNPSDLNPEHRPYIVGLTRALIALDPEPIVAEQIVCHPDLGFSGRLDLRCKLDGVTALIDLKSNRAGRAYPEAHTQLAAYDLAEVEHGDGGSDRLVVVAVGPDGEFRADECVATHGDFLAVLACFRAMANVRRPLDAAYRAERKAAKAADA